MRFQLWLYSKLMQRKQRLHELRTVKQHCHDCGEDGIVLRRISILNLGFWLILGIIVGIVSDIFFFDRHIYAFLLGFWIWFISTFINIKLVRPQCPHCFSTNIHPKEENTSSSTTEPISQTTL